MKYQKEFELLEQGIYRLCVPFYDIYTTVFLLKCDEESLLIDCGTTESDVRDYIIPALKKLDITPTWLICSHMHEDHSGGLAFLLKEYPDCRVGMFSECPVFLKKSYYHFKDEEVLCNRFRILNLKGHSDDSLGIYDLDTKMLLTFDSLQMYGVSQWGTGVGNPEAYHDTLQRVRKLAPKKLITSHDYVPYGYCALGEKIEKYLTTCEEAVNLVQEFAVKNADFSCEEIAQLYHKEYPYLPPIGSYVVEGVLKRLSEKEGF